MAKNKSMGPMGKGGACEHPSSGKSGSKKG